MPNHYDTNKHYYGGLRYSDGAAARPGFKHMKTKVDLRSKTDELIAALFRPPT